MKKSIISLIINIIIILLFSGCSLINPSNLVLPDDLEFLEVVEELDTPEKISQYMIDNFIYESHPYCFITPYELYKTGKGDCNDLSLFACYICNYHGIVNYQALIFYSNFSGKHAVCIIEEDGKYNYFDNMFYFKSKLNDFEEIIETVNELINFVFGYIWSKYIIYDYDMNIIEQGFNQ